MNRIHALNEESSEESEGEEDIPTVTKEAQEQNAFTQYNLALTLLRDKNYDDAGRLLRELLDSSFLVEYTKPEGSEALRQPILMLKYSCLKNMGNILLKQGSLQPAIEYLLQASYLDGTDVTLWHQIGTTAVEVADYVLAVDAFLEGLHCSPRHWPCLDSAICLLLAAGDTVTCLHYVARALALDPGYVRGLAVRDHIAAEVPSTLDDFKAYYPDDDLGQLDAEYDRAEGEAYIKEATAMKERRREAFKHLFEPSKLETVGLLRPLPQKSWLCLGEGLVQLYRHMYDNDISLRSPINLSKVELSEAAASDGRTEAKDEKIEAEEGEKEKDEEVKDEEQKEKEKEPSSSQPDDEGETDDPRGRKRRRNSLSFLEQWIWSGKRRSARVRSTARKDADDNLGQALRALVPRSLMPCKSKDSDPLKSAEDSQDTMELYKLFKDSEPPGGSGGGLNPPVKREQLDRRVGEEGYFATDAEVDEVGAFVGRAGDFLPEIMLAFCQCLAAKQQLAWPRGLARAYLDAYAHTRKHYPHPSAFSSEETPESLTADATITLLHGELLLDSMSQRPANQEFPCEELGQLLLVIGRVAMGAEFLVRLHWLKGHVMLRLKQVDNAIQDFDTILYHMEQQQPGSVNVRLPNCLHNSLVTAAAVEQLLATLTRNQSLCEIPRLYREGSYDALAAILQETLKSPQVQPMSEEESALIPDRQTQLSMLMETLQVLGRQQDCFYWGEACLHEALNKYLSSDDSEQQAWTSTLEGLLGGLLACIETGGLAVMDTLSTSRLSRLVQNMTHVLCQQLEAPETAVTMPIESVAPWIILQRILERAEGKGVASSSGPGSDEEDGEDEIPASLRVMVTAHDFLARRSWCCSNEGALLLHMLDVVVPRLRDQALAASRDELNQALEQAVYCLYGHPNKKTKGRNTCLQEHGVPQISLTWHRAAQLVQLYQPDEMPEFDSYRVGCITADVEGLFKKILTLVPADCDLSAPLAAMKSYIDGTTDELPIVRSKFPRQMAGVYYLLADYNFKNNEWAAAVQYYLLDVCLNPRRLDSWAGMALARGSQLEVKLNSCEALRAPDFLAQAAAAQRCYRRALDVDAGHSLLWIEYGSFVYTVHSFCCRLLKQENEGMSMQVFVMVETRKEEMLAAAVECFSTANKVWYGLDDDHGIQDERWLHHYMLGKAAEKTDSDPERFLSQYAESIEYLHKGGATYPRRISYNSPQNLAVEALEVYYRTHASILKYLESREGKGVTQQVRTLFEKYIEKARVSPFITKEGKENDEEAKKRPANEQIAIEEDFEAKRQRIETNSSILSDVIDTMEALIGRVTKAVDEASDAVEVVEISDANEIIEISDDETSRTLAPARTKLDDKVVDMDVEKLVEERETEVGIVERDAKEVTSEDATRKNAAVDDKEACVKDAYVGDDVKMDVSDGNALTRGQICDIIGVSIPDEEADGHDGSRPNLGSRASGLSDGRSNSFEENFLKFIASDGPTEACDETETSPMKRLLDVVEYLDETDGKVITVFVEPKAGGDEGKPGEAGDDTVSKFEELFPKDGETVSKSDENADKDSKDLRRSSQESTATTATGTTLTTSSDDESSDSSDSSDSSSSSESDSSGSAGADQSVETVVEVKKEKEEKEEKEETEAVVKVPAPKEENVVLDNTDLAAACLAALEECVLRFPQHYKSLYRLGHHYFRSRQHRDVAKCRDLLLGSYRCREAAGRAPGVAIQGLFADRKNSNFFNGVWRIPMSDIDRPGSFASHMSRCVQLLMEVLTELKDHALLLELCVQLRRIPESDKKYLRDSEREQLSRQALSLCLRAARSKISATSAGGGAALLVDMYRAYQRSLKHLPSKEKAFANLLQEAYRQHKKVQGPVLDEAIKFSIQELASIKLAAIAASPSPTTPTTSPLIPPYNPYACPPPKQAKPPPQTKPSHPHQQYPHVPRSRGRPPNVPRAGASAGTGFEYPKATNASWKPPANALTQQQQQYATMLAQNMLAQQSNAMPYYQMHSLFSDMGLASMANLGAANMASLGAANMANYNMGANLNMANMSAANMSAANMNMSGLGSLDQQINALNMFNYQVQMGNYQSELMRHYGTPQHTAAGVTAAPPSMKDRPNISITPVAPTKSGKIVEKTSAAVLQEKMMAAAAKSTKSFPTSAPPAKADAAAAPLKTAAQIAAAQLAEIAARSRRGKGAAAKPAQHTKPAHYGAPVKGLPSHATLLKDNQIIGTGVSITQIQQGKTSTATDPGKQLAAFRKSHAELTTVRSPQSIPDLNLSLKGLGASLTLMKPSAYPPPPQPPPPPPAQTKYRSNPYKAAPAHSGPARSKSGIAGYDYLKASDPRGGGHAKPPPNKPPQAHATISPTVHDLTKFSPNKTPNPSPAAAPSTFSSSTFNKFSYASSSKAKPADAKSLGSEITVTQSAVQRHDVAQKPLDLAAIPKGITITNVLAGKAKDPQQQKVSGPDKSVTVKKIGKDAGSGSGAKDAKKAAGESVETITLD